MTAAQRYLVDLVQTWTNGGQDHVPLPPDADPAAVANLLRAHDVEAALGPLVPPDHRPDDSADRDRLARARTDFLLLECERLWPVLSGADWQPILLKGAALALDVYADPTERWFLDLDVLVPRSEVAAVCERMEAAGYRHLAGKRDALFYDKYHLHRIMLGPQGSVVEIHWDLTLPGSVYSHDVQGMAGRAVSRPLGAATVQCASHRDQILHACYQNIADGFVDLRRVLDLALLLRGFEHAEWLELVAEGRDRGFARVLYATLHMVKWISGVPVPPAVMQALDPGPVARRTLAGLHLPERCLSRQSSLSASDTQLLHLLLTPSFKARIREIGRALWVGEARLLDQGYTPDEMPGWPRRLWLGLRQVKTVGQISWRAAAAFASG